MLASCALVGSLAAIGSAQQSLTPVWTHASPTNGWIPRQISLGNAGSQAWTQLGPYTDYTRLYSAQQDTAVGPVWEHQDSQVTYVHAVASAETCDVHATLHDQASSAGSGQRNLILRKYHSSSSSPDWSYTFPFTTNGHDDFGVEVSTDGQRLVAHSLNMWTGRMEILVFNAGSPTPILQTGASMGMNLRRAQVNTTATKLLLATDSRVGIFDLVTGNVDGMQVQFDTVYNAFALSNDGSVYAYGITNGFKVYRRNSAGAFELRLTRTIAGPAYCDGLAIAANGSTLVAAYDFTDGFHRVSVEALDLPATLAQAQPVQLMHHDLVGTGTLQNLVSKVDCSADGTRFALGTWGDGTASAPEIAVYTSTSNTPLGVLDLPGSVLDLDLAADGRHLVVASKGDHNNVFSGGGRIDMLELGQGDLRIHGAPRAGTSLSIDVQGVPGTAARLLVAPATSQQPTTFPRMGTLYLATAGMTVVDVGTVQGDGFAHASLPLSAGSIGQTLCVQGLKLSPRRLTRDWARLTVLP